MSAVRAIVTNPGYLGCHVSGRTKKVDVLVDPDLPALGHLTRQHSQDRADGVTAVGGELRAIVDDTTGTAPGVLADKARTNAGTPPRRKTPWGIGTRRRLVTRWRGLVVCDSCGKKLQGGMVRGQALYRCYRSNDYAVPVGDHPPSLSVHEVACFRKSTLGCREVTAPSGSLRQPSRL